MSVAKIAISIDKKLLKKLDKLVDQDLFQNRSQAISTIIEAGMTDFLRERFKRECEKLDPAEEQAMAEEGLYWDTKEWEKF
ncbi:MAG: hypothetical protein A3C44_02055 [Gammaproteobacteria bacterium RIFCSPHIGHO2_02_FULL_39_13]|nr:MAG: hypothetical protein A3C44_02055 [Gammaproteobacteria bacterium RIFCSPHIGHO2_02_FULL_39_13]OGT48320.1 MAG: hypothetical protein A3E53_05750 [Gammaproteobacteria bacterium RIFCSPHIGHO2_12_FULL_39_24]